MKLKFIIFTVLCCLAGQVISDCSQSQLDFVLVIDSSGSIGIANFNYAREALVKMVENLNIGPRKVRVAVINYSTNSVIVRNLDSTQQNKNELIAAVKNLVYFGQNTATGDALNLAYRVFNSYPRDATPRVAIVFTDGYSNTGLNVLTEATRLKNADVTIYSVGITSGINMAELNSMSSSPASKHVKLVQDFAQLYGAINNITTAACDIPIFINTAKTVTAETEKDELKKFQVDTVKNKPTFGIFDIIITNKVGFTTISNPPTFYTGGRENVKAELFQGPFEKITENGERALSYLVSVPTNAQFMYFDTLSKENINTYDLVVKNF